MSTALAPTVLLAHDVGVSTSPVRRCFTAAYTLKIVTAADVCEPGDLAALLRREGLSSSHLMRLSVISMTVADAARLAREDAAFWRELVRDAVAGPGDDHPRR